MTNLDFFLGHQKTILWGIISIPLSWFLQVVVLRLLTPLLGWKKLSIDRSQITRLLRVPLFAFFLIVFWQNIFDKDNLEVIFERLYIFTLIWLAINLVSLSKIAVKMKFDITAPDNLQARKMRTQFQFLEKTIKIILIVIGVALVLMTFESVRRFGNSLIASAGLAGIIIGIAAQKSLGTFLSGFQVAFTQPIRLDDVVIVEGEWGQIEEITLTYVVIKIWDRRRLVVPITYFTDKPFQNWTRNESALLGTVFLNLDFTFSVESIRGEFDRILTSSPLWDKKVAVLQVTDATEKSMQVRFLMSARNSSESFDLRCFVREKMISFIQQNHPGGFPAFRIRRRSF
jgi:small-conductance mechanosensitive channel